MSNSNWPSLVFDLAPRDDTGLPIAGASASTGPIELLQVFAGATGPTGPPYVPSEFSVVTSAGGLQVLTLPTPECYAVAGTALSLPADLNVLPGDLITFVYPS